MKLHKLAFSVGIICLPRLATGGGILVPGAGVISTSRAGAAVASADDGEALVLNPAGLAKTKGTTITVSAALIKYAMEFQRRGTYDDVPLQDRPYEGQPFANSRNDVQPPLGIGTYQPIPILAVTTDLGGLVPNLRLAAGIYAPNAYPFRDMCSELAAGCQKYVFNNDAGAPPATRYDIMKQEAAVFLPSIAASYRIIPALDVGLRLSAGVASIKSTTALWATLGTNYEEDVEKDGTFAIDASDGFVPAFGLGIAYRPTPNIEIGFNYASEFDIHAKGTSVSELGPNAGGGLAVAIGPSPNGRERCAAGGTMELQKACVDFALPRNAQLGGRYKFLDAAGALKADVELDLDWENWGKSCSVEELTAGTCVSPGDYRVTADSFVYLMGVPTIQLRDAVVKHGLQDTFGVRLGGSYHIPLAAPRADGESTQVIVRGGLAYDTAAAKTGWLRADLDGAARTTITVGAAYRAPHFEVSVGGGAILEGSPSNPNVGDGAEPCNPTAAMAGCGTTERQGPDPIDPLFEPGDGDADNRRQLESPFAQGDYKSHYVLFMLGVTAWF
jgi:long-subunit fatty acid transport protein